ncbi:hypothetical protein NYZ99_00175 [Maribacter litopenaei]|uniref:Uncharacterized protein n=1 Tax=Maribacter litopenaei TaxID=2976127 RepID=A0ABY5YA57_9FLAO|nr:hypothetical protein [Maribacter litopenaei]UWX55109.1 hypothetical protein NYZ99_00175 [Maribacter litopenaei]
MPIYTLCPNYVNHSCEDNDDFVDILLSFCQTNGRKIAFDEKDCVIEAYRKKVRNKENLNTWLKFLTMKSSNYEVVSMEVEINNDEYTRLMISVSSSTFDRNLTCESKTDYLEFREIISKEEIKLIDKDELRDSFKNSELK